MQNYYVLVADCLGFQNINSNLTGEALHRRVEDWLALYQASLKVTDKIQYSQLSSDSLFYLAEPSLGGLSALIQVSKFLLKRGVRQSLPIRGGISLGEAHTSDTNVYGAAVVEAYRLCNAQEWIGVIVDNRIPEIEELFNFETLIPYLAPLKTSTVKQWPTVVWDIPPYGHLHDCLINEGLAIKGEPVLRDSRIKFQNTVDFSIFLTVLKILRKKGEGFDDPKKRYGHTHNDLAYQFVNNFLHQLNTKPETDASWLPGINEKPIPAR